VSQQERFWQAAVYLVRMLLAFVAELEAVPYWAFDHS
jgi:hypothetical protein